jgi:hemerythrin superfamily protein
MALKEAIADVVETAKSFLSEDGAAPEPSTDAIELLKADHRRVEALFKQILEERSLALVNQRANIQKVLAELTLHAKIEETIFYPAVYGKTKKDTDERLEVLEAFEEHGSMKDLIKKIKRATGRDETLKAKIQVLSEITEHHVKEEESEFFPEAKTLLGEKRLREIGLEIAKLKARSARSGRAKARGVAKTSRRVSRGR